MLNLMKIKVFSIVAAIFILTPMLVSAGVYFLNSQDQSTGAGELVRPCFIDYPLTTCPSGKTPQNFCPTDSRYFKTCGCDTSVYKYTASNCTNNKTLSGNQCDGKYDTCGCDAKYQYTTSNCTSGKVLSGNQCDSKYEKCGCDAAYTKTCNTNNLIPVDASDSCDGKYKSCKCPTNYVTCDNGGEVGASQCTEENGTVKYTSCKKACQKNTATCAAEIGGVPTDWTIKNATESNCECSTTKKYVMMQNDFAPIASGASSVYDSYRTKFKRIKATRTFGNVNIGDLGGYIEKEENLSQTGNSWVGCDQYGCAIVMDNAKVYGNAQVYGGPYKGTNASKVYEDSNAFLNVTQIRNNAEVYGDATVYGGSRLLAGKVYGKAILHGFKRHPEDNRPSDARSWETGISIAGEVYDNAQMYAGSGLGGSGSAGANNNPKLYGDAVMGCSVSKYDSVICARITYLGQVYGNAKILGHAEVTSRAKVYGYAKIHGNARIGGDAQVYGNAVIGGNSTYVEENSKVFGNAKIEMVGNHGGSSMLYICGNTSISGSVTMTGNIQTGGSSVCSGTYTKGQATISKVQACSQCK